MDEQQVAFERANPVLMSGDYGRSRAFYADKLGFTIIEEGGDPAQFGIFRRGTAQLFIDGWHGGQPAIPTCWDAYIHVTDVTALAKELEAAGVALSQPVHTTGYGMTELEITDPDGNVICFGCDAEKG